MTSPLATSVAWSVASIQRVSSARLLMAQGCTTTNTVSLTLPLNVLFGWRAALFDFGRQHHSAQILDKQLLAQA